ncbi:hypothetical protein OGAPHI_002980 [Ogataea philodendri]|uniref:Lon protease homolog 2, peroxisomal n=2 Tax=Saccharomycotina TaxID=147537 RepID=A0A9P8P904_9ASCO|nr:uncharacterized protein OGAPHI_002980 [Ogataea philodendri]KAH3667331.1 hypothetical protein OGAPHI_002980 [Ogataea philodendri]
MSSKSSGLQFQLPLYQLQHNLVFLPGITYRVLVDKQLASELAKRWLAESNTDAISALSAQFNVATRRIVACMPGVDKAETCTVCVVTGFYQMTESTLISFKALTRGRVVQVENQKVHVDLELTNHQEIADMSQFERLFTNVDGFLAEYKNGASDGDSNAKSILLRLLPLATLLYNQLSASDVSSGLANLKKVYARKTGNFGHYNDVLVALFPFPVSLKLEYLQSVQEDRVGVLLKALDFANRVFEEQLNVDYLNEIWSDLDLKNGKSHGNLARSQFISSHLKNLRALVEQIGLAKPSARRAQDEEDDDLKPFQQFIESIDHFAINDDGKRLITKDFQRLKQMQSSSSEYQVLRTYLEVVMDMPWQRDDTEISFQDMDLSKAKQQLDADHYGMESAKERILEYLAVLNLHNRNVSKAEPEFISDDVATKPVQPSLKAPILLLTGPPGVGKTSLAKSIAGTLGRKFQRISVGGLNNYADLKGHRRTYVGAIPGLVIQALRRSQSMNPVILLDEVDKLGSNSRKSDSESALLEILDPEQNTSFQDHYLGFPVDLSQVLFVCTANDLWELSDPLRDRMEVIELAGYTYREKVEICKKYIIPRQIERAGLPNDSVRLDDAAILKIATGYTREAGIRNLERLIGAICRGKAIESQLGEYSHTVAVHDLAKYLGVPTHLRNTSLEETKLQNEYGVVNGLSYNTDGSGSLLRFEMVGLPGSQNMNCTGRLGSVLLESSQIANTLVGYMLHNNLIVGTQDYRDELLKRYENLSVHLHVPEGAISKDGPSAGITMTLCLLSLVLQRKVPDNLAMTGEITLTGKVLPIGGVREKLLGAHLAGKVDRVLLPRQNRKDVIEDYIYNMKDRTFAKELMAKLLEQEEQLLPAGDAVFGEPEKWVQDSLGLEIVYVGDFSDVLARVWSGDVAVSGAVREARM